MTHPLIWAEPARQRHITHREAMARLSAAPTVLLGERHDHAADHRWQAMVIAGLAALCDHVVVGFEMFPRRAQAVLDEWVAGHLDEAAFLERSRWSEVWGFDPELYFPVFRLCRDLGLPMLALNVDRPVVSLVGREGWDALAEEERAWLTPARPAGIAYRRYLFEITGGVRPGRAAVSAEDPAFDRFVRAQQVWDRAFACAIAGRLAAAPAARVVALIGRGHLEYRLGVPDQLDDLGIPNALVALPGDPETGEEPIADLVFTPPAVGSRDHSGC